MSANLPNTQCMQCRHFRSIKTEDTPDVALVVGACDAFPQRIPDSIWREGKDHTQPVPGDHGIRFEPKP